MNNGSIFPCKFCQTSEVDQVLECEIQLTMYRVMIWVQDGLITIPTTLIIRSYNVGFVNLECL